MINKKLFCFILLKFFYLGTCYAFVVYLTVIKYLSIENDKYY